MIKMADKFEAKCVGWQNSDDYGHSYVIHKDGETVALILGREDEAGPVAEEIVGASRKIDWLRVQVNAQAKTIAGLEFRLQTTREALLRAQADGLTGHLHCACYICKALKKLDEANKATATDK